MLGILVFEEPDAGAYRASALRAAQVLADARVPVVVLNACQSGAVGKELEAAVATRILGEGIASVVAMAYSVYAVAAAEFMAAFYETPGVASFCLDGVIGEIGFGLYGEQFARLEERQRREVVLEALMERRMLLVWDNFESVGSMPNPDHATPPLNEAGRRGLLKFLKEVADGGQERSGPSTGNRGGPIPVAITLGRWSHAHGRWYSGAGQGRCRGRSGACL